MPARVLACSVTNFEASPRAALRHARRGDLVNITSHNRVVARLVPLDAAAPRSVVETPGSPWVDEEPLDLNLSTDISDLVQKYR